MQSKKSIIKYCIFVVIFSLLSSALATLILKYSGNIIYLCGEKTFGDIFKQLNSAQIIPAFLIALIGYSLVAFLLFKIRAKSPRRFLIALFVCIISFILITVLTVLFSTVNGIRVLNVVFSLIKNFKNGLAEELAVTL